jgi:drug/metabolite transporter (DMT)-like permease
MVARLVLLACVIIWGWTFVATKICLQFLSPAELLAARFVMATPLVWLIVRLRGHRLRIDRKLKPAALMAAALFLVHFFVQALGLLQTSATNTAWLVAVSPLAMAILASLILREHPGPRTWIGIVVAFAGVLLLVSNGRVAELDWLRSTGDWLALASAFTWALYTIATRDLSRTHAPMVVTSAMLVPCTLALSGYVLATSDLRVFTTLSTEAALALAFLGFVGMGLAQWFWLEGVARLGAAQAGVFLYVEPLATTALAVPYLNEPFGTMGAVGGVLVLLGVFYASRGR